MAAGRIVTSTLMPARDRNDRLVAGAKLYVYTNRTTTPVTVYTTSALSTAQANPVVANSSGQFPDVWIEAGTAASPSLYTVSITGPNGESIANPSVFDDYSPSLNYASDVTSYWRALLLTASQSAFLTALGNIASSFINVVQSGTGAATRTLQAWFREREVSVKDFGALGDGTTNDTAAVQAAYAAGHYHLYFPPGTYRLGQVGLLGAGGMKIRGAGRGVNGLLTTIKPIASMTAGQAIFYNQVAATGTAGYGLIEDISFDLLGQNCIAVDLSSCNNFNVNRCHFQGGANYAAAAGVGVKFGAPLNAGAYTNTVSNCSGDSLAKGVEWGTNANSNMLIGGEFLNCLVGADAAPATYLDTPRIIGTRFEGCGVDVKVRAIGAELVAIRHEASKTADVQFVAGSDRCEIFGGYTAAGLGATLLDPTNCTNLVCHAGDLGWYDVHNGAKYLQGVHVVSGVGQTVAPTLPTNVTASMFWTRMAVMFNDITLEGVNNSNDNSCIMAKVDANNELEFAGFDRKFGIYRDINIGGGSSVNPIGTGVTDLGKTARRWRFADLSSGVKVAGNQVVGARNTGWTAMTGTGSKGALAAAAAGTASAAYAQAELQGALNRIAALEARMKSYDDALFAHGQIGP